MAQEPCLIRIGHDGSYELVPYAITEAEAIISAYVRDISIPRDDRDRFKTLMESLDPIEAFAAHKLGYELTSPNSAQVLGKCVDFVGTHTPGTDQRKLFVRIFEGPSHQTPNRLLDELMRVHSFSDVLIAFCCIEAGASVPWRLTVMPHDEFLNAYNLHPAVNDVNTRLTRIPVQEFSELQKVMLAFAMVDHLRLGAEAPGRMLPPELFPNVFANFPEYRLYSTLGWSVKPLFERICRLEAELFFPDFYDGEEDESGDDEDDSEDDGDDSEDDEDDSEDDGDDSEDDGDDSEHDEQDRGDEMYRVH